MKSILYSGTICLALLLSSGKLSAQGLNIGPLGSEFQAHMAAAKQAQEAQDYATAEKEYLALLKLDPGFAEIHMNLGLIYQLQDRQAEAIRQFRAALKLKPSLTGANFFLGVNYCRQGDGSAAIPHLKAAAAQNPQQVEILSWLATAQDLAGQRRAEVATLNRALELQPRNIDLLYLLGQAYERLGKQQVAGLKKSAPNSVRAEQLVAESYAASNEWPSAVIHFQNALAKHPDFPGLHVQLGEVYLRAGRLKQASAEFDSELQQNPNNLRAIVRRGEAKLLRGETKDALQDWNRALAADPAQVEKILGIREMGFGDAALEQLPDTLLSRLDEAANQIKDDPSPAASLALAFIASQKNQPATISSHEQRSSPNKCLQSNIKRLIEAQRYSTIAACLSRTPRMRVPPDMQLRVASALAQAGDYESALKTLDSLPPSQRQGPEAAYWRAKCFEKLATAAYLRLYQADPNSYRVHELLGDLAATRNDDAKAIEEYRAALALNSTAPNLHYNLGHLLWKGLNVPEARAELEAELKINPRHAGALHDLGNTYLLEHQPEVGLPYLKRAEAADPDDPDIHRDLGTAYFQLKDYNKAEAEYKLALANDQDGSVHYKLAKVYQLLGKKAEADREFAIYTAMNQETHSKLEQRGRRLADIERPSE